MTRQLLKKSKNINRKKKNHKGGSKSKLIASAASAMFSGLPLEIAQNIAFEVEQKNLKLPGVILIGKEFMTPELPNGKRRVIVNRRGYSSKHSDWTGTDVNMWGFPNSLWFFGYAQDENGIKYWAPTPTPREDEPDSQHFHERDYLDSIGDNHVKTKSAPNVEDSIKVEPSHHEGMGNYIRLISYLRRVVRPGDEKYKYDLVEKNDNDLIHEALIQNGWIAREISEDGALLPPSRESPADHPVQRAKDFPDLPFGHFRVHYIHESMVGPDGLREPDDYWKCEVGEGDNYGVFPPSEGGLQRSPARRN